MPGLRTIVKLSKDNCKYENVHCFTLSLSLSHCFLLRLKVTIRDCCRMPKLFNEEFNAPFVCSTYLDSVVPFCCSDLFRLKASRYVQLLTLTRFLHEVLLIMQCTHPSLHYSEFVSPQDLFLFAQKSRVFLCKPLAATQVSQNEHSTAKH